MHKFYIQSYNCVYNVEPKCLNQHIKVLFEWTYFCNVLKAFWVYFQLVKVLCQNVVRVKVWVEFPKVDEFILNSGRWIKCVIWSLCSSGCWYYEFGFGIEELSSYFVNSVNFMMSEMRSFITLLLWHMLSGYDKVKTWLCYCSITFVVTSIRWIFVQILSKVIVPLIHFILVFLVT